MMPFRRFIVFSQLFCASVWLVMPLSVSAQSVVKVQQQGEHFQLLRDGRPYRVKGVGGETHLSELAAAGGNSVRTWGADNLGQILDEAHRHGLTVCAGLWLGHQRHGFNYQSRHDVLKQLDEQLAHVKAYKDHPALLMWGVGNEAEGDGNDPSVWYAIDHIAREIKRLDPNHPTMTVIAELGEDSSKVDSIRRFCPHIDIVGINSYGGVESIANRYREAGGRRPYIITEHGPPGPWEAEKTPWGSPIEWTSTRKGKFYATGYRLNAVENADLCLGTYAFLWGHKQETTATWFGMLLPDGSRLEAVDAMSEMWTGTAPVNRCPQIDAVAVDRDRNLKPGDRITATVGVEDPEGDPVEIRWVLRSDSATIGAGGDPQQNEKEFAANVEASGRKAVVTIPDGGGGYRLFAYARDTHGGAAVANAPLHVGAPVKLRAVMPVSPLPYVLYGKGAEKSVFVPSGYMGNTSAVKMQLDCKESPHSAPACIKVQYTSGGSWGGVLWQSPAEDWEGKLPGGANLTGATQLEFWVRGAQGGEKVSFVFGVLDGNQPYRDTARGELKDVQLTKEWNRLTIPLRGLDLRQIKTGFGWSLAGQGRPVTFYLDDIRYVKD